MSDTFELYGTTSFTDGDMTAVLHDTDGIENKLLHAGRENSIIVDWHVEGSVVPLVGEHTQWHLEAHFEPIGSTGPGATTEPNPVDVPWGPPPIPPSTLKTWNCTIPILADTIAPGAYKAVVLISFQYQDVNGIWIETNMSGFYEIPMVRFTAQP